MHYGNRLRSGWPVIAGAAVEGKNIGTGLLFPTVTTSTGNYSLTELPPGNYEVTITTPGFKTLNRGPLEVGARQTLRIDETLLVTKSAEISLSVTTSRLSQLGRGQHG